LKRRARLCTGAALLSLAYLNALGCDEVLDLTEREDAIERLCRCSEQLPDLDGDCSQVLSQRLSNAAEPTRASWLSYFEQHCGGDGYCSSALDCYQQPGTCSMVSCRSDEECCPGDGNMVCNLNVGECRQG